jgi:hypothetical protein
MPQTLLSIAGLLIVTLLSFSQQQAGVRSQQQAIRAEYQQMAVGVAKQSIEAIRAREYFDRAVRIHDDPDVEDDFTRKSSPEWGGDDCIRQNKFVRNPNGGHACTAIEDFHDDETMEMDNADGTIPVQIPDGTIQFQIEVQVHYAKEGGGGIVRKDPGDPPTRLKKVSVRVQDCRDGDPSDGDPCDGESILPQPIVLSEVIGYTG